MSDYLPFAQLRLTLQGHTRTVTTGCFSPCGQYILSASCDKTLKVWNAQAGTLIHTLQGHTDWVLSGCFSPCGQYILSASHDKTLKVWTVSTPPWLRSTHSQCPLSLRLRVRQATMALCMRHKVPAAVLVRALGHLPAQPA